MNKLDNTPPRWNAARFPLFLLGVMTLIQIAATIGLAGHPMSWANIPRTIEGIPGILTSHLRHGGWGHLLANALPLVALPTLAGMMAPTATRQAWWIIPPLAGLLLWLFGRPLGHVGASALVYGWFFFLMGLVVFHRSWRALLGAAFACLLFGSLFWVFRGGTEISWDGHATGALAGCLAAWILRPKKSEIKDISLRY